MIWTRVTPGEDAHPGSGVGRPVPVEWQVATDERFARVGRSGHMMSSRKTDYTIKVDLEGLASGTMYRYRFAPAGRSRRPVRRGPRHRAKR